MALAPYFAGVTPATAATLPQDPVSSKHYVSPAALNQIMDNFVNWKFNVNAGNNDLSGLGVLTFGASGYVSGRAHFAGASEVYAVGVKYNSASGPYYIGASNSATPDLILSNAGGTEAMRVTFAGYVGIGTATPLAALDVKDGMCLSQYGVAKAKWYHASGEARTYITGESTSELAFTTNGTIRLAIGSTGAVNVTSGNFGVLAGTDGEGGQAALYDHDNAGAWLMDVDNSRNLRFFRSGTPNVILQLNNSTGWMIKTHPGPYDSNAAAAGAGLPVGGHYRDSNGFVRQVF